MAIVKINDTSQDSAQFRRMSEDQVQKIHWASLEILERHGALLHDQESIDILKKAGATAGDGNTVYIPAGMVEKAFSTVPKRVILYNRHGDPAMPVYGERCFYGPGSDCMTIIDHRDNQRRTPVLDDIRDGITLCDALDNIDFVMSLLLPTDVDQTIADVYQMEIMLNNSIKPIINVAYSLQGLMDAVEMAEAVMGGEEALRRNPLMCCYINVTSGLNHNQEALQKLLYLAGKGLPVMYIPSSVAGVNCPVTPAGAAAFDNAGVLAGLVLSQLKREGVPYIMPGMPPSPMDMRSMTIPYSDPQRGVMTSLARLYRLPAFGIGGSSDAKIVDGQATAEAALTLFAESLLGGNIIHDLGYLETALTYSFVQLTICEEIVTWIEKFMGGVPVNDETLALDVIAKTGAASDYLGTDHTMRNFRNTWLPTLFERDTFNEWEEKGSKNIVERGKEKVEKLLKEHKPEPLTDEVQQKLRNIVQRAENATIEK